MVNEQSVLEPLKVYCKSVGNPVSVGAEHQTLNKIDNRMIPETIVRLANMNQRLVMLDKKNKARTAKRLRVLSYLAVDRRSKLDNMANQ